MTDRSRASRTGVLLSALVFLIASAPGWAAAAPDLNDGTVQLAQGNSGNKAKGNKAKGTEDAAEERLEAEIADEVLDGVFGEDERETIERYVRTKGVATQSLPPGIAKNVARGKPLPPGIAKRGLPTDLESRLPPLREGLERVIAGDDVTIVEEGTRVVVDVLKDVLAGR